MDFELGERLEGIRERARAIAVSTVAKHAPEHDRDYSMPVEALDALYRDGLLGLCVPRDLGGEGTGIVNGVDPLAFLLVIEELGRVDMSTAHCFQVHSHTSQMLAKYGTVEQQKRWFEPVMKNGGILSWTGSEPGRTARGQYKLLSEAQPTQTGYVLNGVKVYGTNASVGVWNVVGVSVAGMGAKEGFLLVLVPRGAKGFNIDEEWWRPTGMRAAVSPRIELKDLEVPSEDVLVGPGFYPSTQLGSRWHLGFAANHLGAAQGLFDFALEYLPKRGTGGNPHTQRVIGEMRMRIEAARGLVYRAASLWSTPRVKEAEEFSLMAKLYAIETAEWAVNETIRVVGSTALLDPHPLNRMIRDIHVHSTHANLYNTAQLIGRARLGLDYDATEQQ